MTPAGRNRMAQMLAAGAAAFVVAVMGVTIATGAAGWYVAAAVVLGYVVLALAAFPWMAFMYASVGMLVCAVIAFTRGQVLPGVALLAVTVVAGFAGAVTRDAAKRGAR